MHDVIPHAAMVMRIDEVIGGTILWDRRYVTKLSNLLSLTEYGFYGHLEEDGLFYLNMHV